MKAVRPRPAGPPPSVSAAPTRLLEAAIESFADVGYHATTTRGIAARAKMSAAAVYVHYKNKLQLLKLISRMGHEKARSALATAMDGDGSYRDRLYNSVYAFARWHVENQTIARVVQYEYHHLPNRDREAIRSLRRAMQDAMTDLIREGVEAGEFKVQDPAAASLAIVSMCVDLCRWYSTKEPRSPEQIGEMYAEIALRIVE